MEFSLKEVLQTDELIRQNERTEIISNTTKLQQTDNQFSSIIPCERFSSFQKLVKVISSLINITKYCRQKVKESKHQVIIPSNHHLIIIIYPSK